MKQLSVTEYIEWIRTNKQHVLIDVREDWERQVFNIGGIHIPLSELQERKDEIEKVSPIVFYCEKGIRSQIIIQRLEDAGYENLYNLTGGMKAWRQMDTE